MESNANLQILLDEIDWLEKVIQQAICTYLMHQGHEANWLDFPLPDLSQSDTPYAQTVAEHNLGVYGRLAISLGFATHLKPEILDVFFGKNQLYDRAFTEFGGAINKDHNGFLPTGQTLCFLAANSAPQTRAIIESLLSSDSVLIKEQILSLTPVEAYLPRINGILSLSSGWLYYFLDGNHQEIEHSETFPAQKVTSNLDWDDAVLNPTVAEHVEEIIAWLKHGHILMHDWGLARQLKPGYRALFYGPPGTGKTLMASLIGKRVQHDVYRIDISMLVSKFIGETEKNLAKIFDIAQHKKWILFFDEADALFGKRTAANSSNDRHANQQTAYLLQRIEDFPGVVILASNLKANMDDAFMRRFQNIVQFTMPDVDERYQLWLNAFSNSCPLHPNVDLYQIAENYELAGGAIINILRFCALAAVQRDEHVITHEDLIKAIRREFKKENKTLPVSQAN